MGSTAEDEARDDAGRGGEDLVGEVEELKREMEAMRERQRELIHIMARAHGHSFKELQAMLAS